MFGVGQQQQQQQQRRASVPSEGSSSTGVGGGGAPIKRECRIFEPQQWRRSVCKNCFRTEPEHSAAEQQQQPQQAGAGTLVNAWPATPAITRKTATAPQQQAQQQQQQVVAMADAQGQTFQGRGNGGQRRAAGNGAR